MPNLIRCEQCQLEYIRANEEFLDVVERYTRGAVTLAALTRATLEFRRIQIDLGLEPSH